jgi:hypothetical protein
MLWSAQVHLHRERQRAGPGASGSLTLAVQNARSATLFPEQVVCFSTSGRIYDHVEASATPSSVIEAEPVPACASAGRER